MPDVFVQDTSMATRNSIVIGHADGNEWNGEHALRKKMTFVDRAESANYY